MASILSLGLLISLLVQFSYVIILVRAGFDQNYAVTWGGDHVRKQNGEVHLSMDKTSGSGFGSKHSYNSGFFHLSIKTPNKDTAGIVTAFYLSSSNTGNHDELDFEFLGNRKGKPIRIQTNIFTNGHGNREQRMNLWFDPSAGFHDYKVLWNPSHIVFFVDDIPIRIFQNQTSRGVEYPFQPMKILVSLWNGEDWATDGGKAKIDWSQAPFVAQFQGFGVDGCPSGGSGQHLCSSSDPWWNASKYKVLTRGQISAYRNARKHITYDYCSDKGRFPKLPPECTK